MDQTSKEFFEKQAEKCRCTKCNKWHMPFNLCTKERRE